jgi:hypothetical protein
MIINSDTAGLNDLRARLALMRDSIAEFAVETGQIIGDNVVQKLGDAAPKSNTGGSAIGDDASGPLSESFSSSVEMQGEGAMVTVETSQSIKLGYVVNGRSDIYPVNKRALYWVGLDHPVKHAGPSQPNDFVSGVIDSVDDIIEPEMQAMVDELSVILEGA